MYCSKMADWIRMLFWVVSGVDRVMDVLDVMVIVEGKGQFWGEFGAWDKCCEGRRRAELLWGGLVFACAKYCVGYVCLSVCMHCKH